MDALDSPFVGRRRELRALTGAFARLPRDGARLALIGGEAGVGKTRLANAVLAQLPENAIVLHGVCRMGGVASPYESVADALRPVLRGDSANSAIARRLVGTLAGPGGATEDATDVALPSRLRSFDAVLEVLGDIEAPAALVVDDVQWADDSSIDLLNFLVRNLSGEQVMLILTQRDEARPRDRIRELLTAIRRTPKALLIPLIPLDADELEELVTATLGTAPSPERLTRIAELTGGNPFFVEQVLADGERRSGPPPPARDLLLDIVDGFDDAAKELCALLAVAGGWLDRSVAELALTSGTLDRAGGDAIAAGAVTRDERRYLLRHSLFRQVILDELLPSDLSRLHAAIAGAAERLAAQGRVAMPPAQIARHWLTSGDTARAIPALGTAARLATKSTALPDAYALWRTLIDLIDSGPNEHAPELQEALIEGAAAARWVGRVPEAIDLVVRALRSTGADDRLTRVRLHTQLARFRRLADGPAGALWDSERAHALIIDGDPVDVVADVGVERASLLMASGRMNEGRALAVQALDLAHATGTPSLEGRALSLLAIARFADGEVDAAIGAMSESRRLAASYGDFNDRISASNNLSFALIESDRLREGLAAATEAIELARRAGVLELGGAAAVAQCNAIAALVYSGGWQEADRRIDALLIGRTDGLGMANWLLGTRAQLRAATGRLDEAERILDNLDPAAMPEQAERSGYVAALAELAIWSHRPERARAATLEALTPDASLSTRAYLLPWCLRAIADSAEIDRLRGDVTAARAKADEAEQVMAAFSADLDRVPSAVSRLLIRAEHTRGTVGPTVEQWEELVAAAAERPYERAYALLRAAEGLSLRSHEQDAARALSEAQQLARSLGAEPLLESIDGLATRAALALSVTPLPDRVSAAAAQPRLTPRERQVLAALKHGLTNRRIARSLNITEKTAGVHVSNIMAKLGVANRTAAAAVAHYLEL